MKKILRRLVANVLAGQVNRLRKKHKITIVAVVGSIGKTSTKLAVAKVLGSAKKVQYQTGNYNDLVTVPLIFFGLPEPSVFNPFQWISTFIAIEKQLRQPYPYDTVVVELGTDGPGYMMEFGAFIEADISVVTAIAPEHMEYFSTLENVAKEELSVAAYSRRLVVNTDLVDDIYLPPSVKDDKQRVVRYGMNQTADFKISKPVFGTGGSEFSVRLPEGGASKVQSSTISEFQAYSRGAAVTVAHLLGLTAEQIQAGLQAIQPVSGRLNQLAGINNSTIIDDTYNASPQAMIAALDVIYRTTAPQKLAILGNMNELGATSAAAHTEVGKYCDPKQLQLVVTLGPDANQYLAPAAEKQGCKVIRTDSPQAAAAAIKQVMLPKALILAKGSQNKVFAEEAVKELLANPKDQKQLVRQSDSWLAVKRKAFAKQ